MAEESEIPLGENADVPVEEIKSETKVVEEKRVSEINTTEVKINVTNVDNPADNENDTEQISKAGETDEKSTDKKVDEPNTEPASCDLKEDSKKAEDGEEKKEEASGQDPESENCTEEAKVEGEEAKVAGEEAKVEGEETKVEGEEAKVEKNGELDAEVEKKDELADDGMESRPETELACAEENTGKEDPSRPPCSWYIRETESLFEEFLLLNAHSKEDIPPEEDKEDNVEEDPVLKQLTEEFRIRLGNTPIANPFALRVRNSTHQIKVIRVLCTSFSEISRVIRCASTMNLYVRCCGNLTSFDGAIYADDYSVLIQINQLGDTDPMCIEKIIKADYTHEKVVKVAAGVTIKEFYNFQQKNDFNLRTDVEDSKHTVVGSIVCGRHTLITYPGGCKYATLADLVREIRIIDSHGNLNTFKDDGQPEKQAALKYAVANLGLLGIVYDVKLAIASRTMTEVSYEYALMNALVNEPEKLMERLKNRYSLQVIYTPFNSMEFYEETGDPRVWRWIAERDQVMIRMVDIIDPKSNLDQHDTIKLLEDPGPQYGFLNVTESTPQTTKSCFYEQYITHLKSRNQELTWAIHCYEELPHDCNDLTFSFPTSESGEELATVLKIINLNLRNRILLTKKNFSVNVCIRISFTGSTTLPLCPGKSDDGQSVAHVRITGLRYEQDSMKSWVGLTTDISKQILEAVPTALPQWSTYWSYIEKIDERIVSHYGPYFEEFKKYLDKYDRNGMFFTIRLRYLLYPTIIGYRIQYLTRHNDRLNKLATEIFPRSFSPTFQFDNDT